MATLLSRLRAKDKSGLFNSSSSSPSYPTGLTIFDHRIGAHVRVPDDDGNIIDEYDKLGIEGGTMNLFISESGVGKTTLCVQIAANIARQYDEAFVYHFDAENASTASRIKEITKFSKKEYDEKYVLNREDKTVDAILKVIYDIADEKRENRKQYEIVDDKLDDFGNKIVSLVPTVVIIDSLEMLQSKGAKMDELEGQTLGGRQALLLSQFLKKVNAVLKSANIIVLMINHMKEKPQMGFTATKSPLMYLSNTKNIPGGKAQFYLSNSIWLLDKIEAFKFEETGFHGFAVRIINTKTRQNFSGASCELVFNQETGYSEALSLFRMAKENGLIEGRNPKCRLVGDDTGFTFDTRRMIDYLDNEEFMTAIRTSCMPIMKKMLSSYTQEELNRIAAEQEKELASNIAE